MDQTSIYKFWLHSESVNFWSSCLASVMMIQCFLYLDVNVIIVKTFRLKSRPATQRSPIHFEFTGSDIKLIVQDKAVVDSAGVRFSRARAVNAKSSLQAPELLIPDCFEKVLTFLTTGP